MDLLCFFLSAMEWSDLSLVAIWQAEFWRRATQETYWVDFPGEVSEVLEAHRYQPGIKFEYRLRGKSLTEAFERSLCVWGTRSQTDSSHKGPTAADEATSSQHGAVQHGTFADGRKDTP